jgi:hypothetical protein
MVVNVTPADRRLLEPQGTRCCSDQQFPITRLMISKASGAGGLLAGLRSGDFKHFEKRSEMRRHRLRYIIVPDP